MNYDSEKILFAVRRSVRYHSRRREFFELIDLITTALTLMLSSGTIYTVLSDSVGKQIVALLAAIIAAMSTLNLVFRTKTKAVIYDSLTKRFAELEKKIISTDKPNSEDIKNWTNERLDIEKEEPATKIVLNCLMHNELILAHGYPREHLLDIQWYQSIFAQVFDVFPSKIDYVKLSDPVPRLNNSAVELDVEANKEQSVNISG